MHHSLVFCSICGTLLDPPCAEDCVQCPACSATLPATAFENNPVTTVSSAFPNMPQKPITISNDHLLDGATIAEKCGNSLCDATELVFHTAQLRGADEGQTVFYTCVKCGYKSRMNS